MLRYFNFQEQLVVICLLGVVRLYPSLFGAPALWPLLVDVVCVFSIVHLVGGYLGFLLKNLRRLPELAAEWTTSRDSLRTLAIVREFSVWSAVLFLVLRISRWSLGWEAGLRLQGVEHYDNYSDAALLLLGLSWLLSGRRVLRKLGRIDLTSGRRLLFSYAVLVLGGTLLLLLPVSLQPGQQLKIVDAAFTVVSAITVTGLTSVNVPEVFSLTGLSLILALIQVGGLGVIVITAGLAAATWRRLSLNQSMMSKELYDIPDFGNMPQFLAKVTLLTFTLELLGTFFLFFSLPVELENRFFHALFHSVSAFCNAGFSTLPANLENSPFAGWGLGLICFLIVAGGLGFPLHFEMLQTFRASRHQRCLSANSKLTLAVTIGLLVVGALSIFVMQSFSKGFELPIETRFWQSIFYSVSSRTAGFNMVPVAELGSTCVLVILFLMFVGGGPMSTAGGIKTTTLGVLLATAWATVKGQRGPHFMKRAIPDMTVHRAVTGIILYMLLGSIATILLVLIENVDPWVLVFEVVSAMSTVGLSLGATSELSHTGKTLVILLMLIGRIGLVTFVYAGIGRRETQRYKYPQDSFFVG